MSTINTAQFVELLAKQTNKPIEQVEQELKQFIEEIASVSKGNPLTIEGLGVFRLKKGRLSFESDPAFAVEINYKYAGMQPIEIKKSSDKKRDDLQDAEESEEKPNQETSVQTDVKIGKVTEPISKSKEEKATTVPEEIPVEKPLEEHLPKENKQDEPIQTIALESAKITEPIEKQEEIKKEDPLKDKAVHKKPVVTKGVYMQQTGKWKLPVSIAAAVGIIALVSWFLTRQNEEISTEPTVVKQVEVIQKESPKPSQPEPEKVVADVVTDLTQELNNQENSIETEVKSEEMPAEYGLQGKVAPSLSGSFSVVIYTLSVESRAYAEVADWQKKGYRAFVHSFVTSKGRTLYYVALGQFKTIEDAKSAAATLPDGKNEAGNHHIKRITLN